MTKAVKLPTPAGWDRAMLLPSPSTPSARFAKDETAGIKAQAWVEGVIGHRLPDGGFADALKDGQGLCELVNAIRPGTIAKVEMSTVPFKQMANISAFIQACRALGVREHALFETLDLYNQKRLPQVVRCLFSLSELVRITMPDFKGPYLSIPDKPEVDPAVKAVVDIAKGNIPAPGWGHLTPDSPQCSLPQSLHLLLPKSIVEPSGGALSPAAHAAGQLTYGVYEGGGEVRTPIGLDGAGSNSENRGGSPGPAAVEPGTAEALAAQQEVDEGIGPLNEPPGAGELGVSCGAEMAGSTLPVISTPRVHPTLKHSLSLVSTDSRALSIPTTTPLHERGVHGGGERLKLEETARRKREANARLDAAMEVALWIEGVTGVTFPGKFWSSLKDGVLLCQLANTLRPGLVPRINTARGTFQEMENISAFLAACRVLGVAEDSLFNTKDLHEKRDMEVVVRCIQVLGQVVQSTVPGFRGPYLGEKCEASLKVNARGLRKQLGKGPGARGGIHTLTGLKGACDHQSTPVDVILEHADLTATVTPAESPSGKKGLRPRGESDSAAGSEHLSPIRPGRREGAQNPPTDAKHRPHGQGSFTAECGEGVLGERGQRIRGCAAKGGGGGTVDQLHRSRREEDRGESVVSQIQTFIEYNTKMPWRISGDLYESLRDGWQLALLVNTLRPGAIRRVHNSIQPAKHVQNIANFLIACRRMGVARALLFDVDDLYANRSQTKVSRTLLALRALAADPDFARARKSALIGSSLLVSAVAAASGSKSETASSAAAPTSSTGLWN